MGRKNKLREKKRAAQRKDAKNAANSTTAAPTPTNTIAVDALSRVSFQGEHYRAAVAMKGKVFGTNPDGCNHGAPSGLEEREEAIKKLIVYATERNCGTELNTPLSMLHMIILHDHGDFLSENTEDVAALALADAANLIVQKDYENASFMTTIHMLFSAWINAGKPTDDLDKFEELAAAGRYDDWSTPDWLDKVHVLIYKMEGSVDICRYIHKQLSCDCIKSEKKEAKKDISESGVNCHYCERPGAKLSCDRCKSVTYCSEDCQAEDWRSHHKAQCKWLRGKKPDPDKIEEVKEYSNLDGDIAWFSSTQHDDTASPTDLQRWKEAKQADEALKSLSYRGMVVKEYTTPKLSTDMKTLNELATDLSQSYPWTVMPNRPNPITPRRAKALIPRTVKTLKEYLISHPEYDSKPGYRDSHLDPRSGFQETFHRYFTELPEFQAVFEQDEEARTMSANFLEWMKDRKIDRSKGIEKELEEYVEGFIENANQMNPCPIPGVNERARGHITKSLKDFLKAHPQYNNFRGVDRLWHNDTFGILANQAHDGFREQLRREYEAGMWG